MIVLTRHPELKTCTPGIVDIHGKEFPTIEQPDRNNKPFHSCIPIGDYNLIPHESKKYGSCYIAVNPDLNVYQYENSKGRPENGRYLCLYFHRGSYGKNFQGCAGVGDTWIERLEMIQNTVQTCLYANKLIREEGSYRMRIQYIWE